MAEIEKMYYNGSQISETARVLPTPCAASDHQQKGTSVMANPIVPKKTKYRLALETQTVVDGEIIETTRLSLPYSADEYHKMLWDRERWILQVYNPKLLPAKLAPGYVYLIQEPTLGSYKIGKTKNPEDRLRTFGVLMPIYPEYLCLIETPNHHWLETHLHKRFASKRLRGEWFALSPEDVEFIKRLARQ